ncbi:Ribonuclease [Pigmentiphaga humi]|uniref:Ribonuclease n=1 Tax=Pigmentiphaga humi TaxID=2478468 RepID=A0A3P4B2Y4_9BURK|nr:MBL fold metallo-hydrolase [Pigmentiphaga humi]VCU70659.1 Ribonuclease [Pigmentiphaga humi]
MKLSFLGAAGTVTGSRYLLEHGGRKVLVDCGLFQGEKPLRERNWAPFPFDAQAIDAVVLTHAHLDHSGALPLLMRRGFRGPIYATPATIELCGLLLPDSGHLQEEDAAFANRHRTSRHHPALPLYTEENARHVLRYLQPLDYEREQEIVPGMRVALRYAGHILGAASARIETDAASVLFSGDLGRSDDAIMYPPSAMPAADYLVMESTYGDRRHGADDQEALLAEVVKRTVGRGGKVLIPSFAVGRAQALLLAISRLKARAAIPDVPVFLDSPMAIDMTGIYAAHHAEHRLSAQQARIMAQSATMVRTSDQSREVTQMRFPSIIVSASGMATGGRVLHHLRAMLPDRRNTVVLAGHQARGTRGARLAAGEPTLRIFAQDVPVVAEVVALKGMSAHADAEQLLAWLRTAPAAPRQVFLTHGESGPAGVLAGRIERELGWRAQVASDGQQVDLPA